MITEIFVPKNSIWVSSPYSIDEKQCAIGFLFLTKGILLTPSANEFAEILGLRKEGNLYTSPTSIEDLLEWAQDDLLHPLLDEAIFFPFEERAKFWDIDGEKLLIHGNLIHNRIHQLFSLQNGRVDENSEFNWEEDLAKFVCVTYPIKHPEEGVKVMEKKKGALTSFTTVPAEEFLSFLESKVGITAS
jgi:hypothetical protein